MLKLRAFLFALGFYPVTILYSIPCILIGPFLPFRQRFAFFTGINYFYIYWLKWVCGVDTRIQGREHLPSSGAFVVLGNHQSEWETLYFQILVRPQVVVLKKELLKIPFFGWALGLLKPIALDRSQRRGALKQLLEQGAARLNEGIPIVMFPQGTRVKVGEEGKFNKGGAMLAVKAGVPIVPIVHNAGLLWPGKSFVKYPGVIDVHIGPAVATEGRSIEEVHAEVTQWMLERMKLLGA